MDKNSPLQCTRYWKHDRTVYCGVHCLNGGLTKAGEDYKNEIFNLERILRMQAKDRKKEVGSPVRRPTSRSLFEEYVTANYTGVNEHTFTQCDNQYFHQVTSNTFQGRIQPRYACVQMLWECWRAGYDQGESNG